MALGLLGLGSIVAGASKFARTGSGGARPHATAQGAFDSRGSSSEGGSGLLAMKAPDGMYEIAADAIPENAGAIVSAGVLPVVVVNESGKYRVFNATCTHLGCLVKWDPAQKLFLCPCHGGKYDASGRVIAGPPPYALKEHTVDHKDDLIRIAIA